MTDRTVKLLHMAYGVAAQMGHRYVGSEHLLIAIVRERMNVARNVLRNLGLKDAAVIAECCRLVGVADPFNDHGKGI